jgi:ribonuclease HI
MNPPAPHFLLRSEASRVPGVGQWRFVLRPVDGSAEITAADVEPGVWGERLDLLTILRALESLDQPSEVTLIDCTRYVEQGIQYGLAEWKESDWRWEWFGQMVPIRDGDLWQRMDRALQFHRVDCGRRRFDQPHSQLEGPHWNLPHDGGKAETVGLAGVKWVKYHSLALAAWLGLVASWMCQVLLGVRVHGSGFRG